MAGLAFEVQLTGEVRALEALTAVSKEAAFAQKTAMRAAARKARSTVVKAFAARHKVPMKLFKHRVRFFFKRRAESNPRTEAALWAGFARGLRGGEHGAVRRRIKALYPKAFIPNLKSGHREYFHRVNPSRRVGAGARERPRERGALPIREHELDVSAGAREVMIDAARRVMRTTYPDTFRKDYKRRMDRVRARNRR